MKFSPSSPRHRRRSWAGRANSIRSENCRCFVFCIIISSCGTTHSRNPSSSEAHTRSHPFRELLLFTNCLITIFQLLFVFICCLFDCACPVLRSDNYVNYSVFGGREQKIPPCLEILRGHCVNVLPPTIWDPNAAWDPSSSVPKSCLVKQMSRLIERIVPQQNDDKNQHHVKGGILFNARCVV